MRAGKNRTETARAGGGGDTQNAMTNDNGKIMEINPYVIFHFSSLIKTSTPAVCLRRVITDWRLAGYSV